MTDDLRNRRDFIRKVGSLIGLQRGLDSLLELD